MLLINVRTFLADSSAKGFVARTIAEFEASSAGTDVPAVAADVPAEESGSDTDADDPQPADEPVRRRTRRAATKVYKGDTVSFLLIYFLLYTIYTLKGYQCKTYRTPQETLFGGRTCVFF